MLSGNLKLITSSGEIKKAALLDKHEEIPCIDVATYNYIDYPIKEPQSRIDKLYNFYFPGGVLAATIDQRVLCCHKKILPIGEALLSRTRVHTVSGLCLPHFIENSSPKATVFSIVPVGWSSRAAIISSVYVV